MADTNRGSRPLSPHLTIYRPQVTSMFSILHRLTGIGMAAYAMIKVMMVSATETARIVQALRFTCSISNP